MQVRCALELAAYRFGARLRSPAATTASGGVVRAFLTEPTWDLFRGAPHTILKTVVPQLETRLSMTASTSISIRIRYSTGTGSTPTETEVRSRLVSRWVSSSRWCQGGASRSRPGPPHGSSPRSLRHAIPAGPPSAVGTAGPSGRSAGFRVGAVAGFVLEADDQPDLVGVRLAAVDRVEQEALDLPLLEPLQSFWFFSYEPGLNFIPATVPNMAGTSLTEADVVRPL